MKAITKILVANRGEIACRVFRTAKKLGLGTVAVYSDADTDALHVRLADEAIHIGPARASESYLAIDKILKAAKISSADAIHPGYGFLSENPAFAAACKEAGIVFIGPTPEAMQALGNKSAAKRLAKEVGVPCLKGYQGSAQDDASLLREARSIGFPLLIKAAAGGGGRGMRRVNNESEYLSALASAQTEALNAFGSEEVLLEQLATRARHVEVQVLADERGHVLTLGERDCSVQRRHQKVIEEAPCPVMTADLRARMAKASRELAAAAQYTNAGTVEFLVDGDGDFYFLEMNTRLQVEHPVTELVTGVDLVELQIRAARGESLAHLPSDMPLVGHAIEVRLYAEDPSQGFLPQTGKIACWLPPEGENIRVDAGIATGQVVTPFYDPMLAKIIAKGATRSDACRSLAQALAETTLFGVKTNIDFLAQIIEHPTFAEGNAITSFLDDSNLHAEPQAISHEVAILLAGAILVEEAARAVPALLKGWRSTGRAITPIKLEHAGEAVELRLDHRGNAYQVTRGEENTSLTVIDCRDHQIVATIGARRVVATYVLEGDTLYLHAEGKSHTFRDVTYAPPVDSASASGGTVRSPTSGRVLRVLVAVGMRVAKGDLLAVIEAMKMENHVVAPRAGMVEQISFAEGDQVDANQILVVLADLPKDGNSSKG